MHIAGCESLHQCIGAGDAGVIRREVFNHDGLQRLLNSGRVGLIPDEGMLSALLEARIIGSPFFPAPRDFMASGNFQVLLSFGLQVIHIGYGLVFGNMHASALNAKLNAALTDAQAKDRQKVEVLGYVGHDLRAPLATISGYSALLLTDADERQRKLLQTIERSAKHQLELIDELLEYAKGELQPLALQPVATDLPRLLDDVSDYATALCAQQNNRFRCNITGPMPQQIVLDGKRLQQVLLNLLSNAAKFTRNGAVTLSVAAEPEGNACTLRLAVHDTGIGIDLSQGVDIFGAFQRMQATSSSTVLASNMDSRDTSSNAPPSPTRGARQANKASEPPTTTVRKPRM